MATGPSVILLGPQVVYKPKAPGLFNGPKPGPCVPPDKDQATTALKPDCNTGCTCTAAIVPAALIIEEDMGRSIN